MIIRAQREVTTELVSLKLWKQCGCTPHKMKEDGGTKTQVQWGR